MDKTNYKKEVCLKLTVKELLDLANVFSTADFSEVDFLKIKDKKLRVLFEQSVKKRHKLWLKIMHLAEANF